ncbi:zinc transporter ZIP10 isoform X2 [Chiloscyllium plagiosum]|uniref:zinc transporter ZIP10 isoform X2 n=1 Tax=Chiloscyllium plagiosum TaxID=36176 RepID=UPI001CB84A49|nr:zinc transporter ZIP10 isoform X2 [Chiloscyllium plagiosum]
MSLCSISTMKVHLHTKFCLICLLTFLFHHCNHCHDEHDHEHNHDHNHSPEENHIHKHNDYQISEESYLQNNPSKSSLHHAENKQMYYIQKLFSRYGENGKLTFHGLEKLLSNLGLGEVKVVEVEHEHDEHDHVSHLDFLDLLKHKHGHSHSHSNHTARDQTIPITKVKVGHCKNSDSQNAHTILTTPIAYHQPRHHHRNHHRGAPHSAGLQIHKEGEQLPDLSGINTLQQQPKKRSKKRKKHKGLAKHPEITLTASPEEPFNIMSKPEHKDEHLRAPEDKTTSQHRARKDLSSSKMSHEDHLESELVYDQCLNVSQLLQSYGLSTNSGISTVEFTYLCPALLFQIDSRVCIQYHDELSMEPVDNQDSVLPVWIWGLLSITIISLLSVLGVVLVPIINQVCFKYLLTFLVALAVGTLSGDALLHLMPHSQGNHDHSHHDHNHDHDHDHNHTHGNHEISEDLLTVHSGLWKGLTALGGIYLLFIIEHCIGIFRDRRASMNKKKWRKQKVLSGEAAVGRKLSDHQLNRRSEGEWLDLKTMSGTDQLDGFGEQHDITQVTDLDGTLGSPSKISVAPDLKSVYIHDSQSEIDYCAANYDVKVKPKKHSNHSHHSHGHCHSNKEMQDAGIANIAWMVIMGDGMHNFSDGLAIGASFSASITGGLSTSIAVFCHELPHELGDFAVLINAGMSVKQAIVYNLLSALLAYVGVVIGIAVGQYTHNLTQWIFAITAGMFLYVALVDMLPEMLHRPTDNHIQAKFGHFALQNAGMLCGFAIMLLIAIFEDQIKIHF